MKPYVSTPIYSRGCRVDLAEDGSVDDVSCEDIEEFDSDWLEQWRESGLSEREIVERIEESVREDLVARARP